MSPLWIFHNGDQRAATDGRPRGAFDLRDGALYDQLDSVELEVLRLIQEYDKA
jgi:hypothetical protein